MTPVLRRLALIISLVLGLSVLARGLVLLVHWLTAHEILGTRLMAVFYMICDVSIASSLVLLLITRERRAPLWLEKRLPYGGRWLWHFLLCLTILAYAALAPTFLFLYVQFRKH